MLINRPTALAVCLMLAIPARAADVPPPAPSVGDVVYKGVIGKALDAVPMDPEERANLQRTSAVVSGTLTGRSISVWAGLANPIFLIAGLAWGLFSASNIKAAEPVAKQEPVRVEPIKSVQVAQPQVAVLSSAPVEDK